eukprot:359054-Chlamydomonas_euryale.AAC.9
MPRWPSVDADRPLMRQLRPLRPLGPLRLLDQRETWERSVSSRRTGLKAYRCRGLFEVVFT